jgi:hypothetical protein
MPLVSAPLPEGATRARHPIAIPKVAASRLVNLRLAARDARTAGDHFYLLAPACIAAVLPWWRILQARVVQVRHRQRVGPAWCQPSCSLRQSPPVVTVMARCFWDGAALARPPDSPQPGQLRRQRPGAVLQILQVAVAVEGPAVDAAGPAAPVAGLRGARTGVIRLRPAGASVGLVDPRAGRDANLPGPTGLPAGHQLSPPLAWLLGSDQPAKQAGTASRSRIAYPRYAPAVGSGGTVWVRPAGPRA